MANNRRLAQVGSFVGSTSSDKLAFTANTGIGTTNPRFTLEVGAVGASGTSLFVNGDAFVSGALTATSFFGSVTGDITGNADTATALQTARDFSVSGDVTTSSAVSFDGTGNVGLAVTLTETGVAAGSYGASNLIPRITVDSKGRITSATTNAFAIIQDTSPQLGGNLDLNSKNVTGTGNFNVTGVITATTFVKSGGTSSQFLKADGTVDSNTYLTAEAQTLDGVLTLGNTSSNGMSVGVVTASSLNVSGVSTFFDDANFQNVSVGGTLSLSGAGSQFFAFNEDTVKVKFANWYSSNARQYGMGQLWFETWFAAIDNNPSQSLRDERRIGFYLEQPNNGSSDSGGTSNIHPTNDRMHIDINGVFVRDNFEVSGDANISGVITATSFTGNLALSNVTGLGANVATFLATPSSANLASAVTGETGSGALVFATSPTLVTPTLGAASATSINASGVVTATGGFNLGISSAGTSITSGSPVTTLNFVGTGNTFAFNGTTVDISIAGGSGGGGGGVSEVETTVSTTNATGVGSFAVATYRSADVIAQISQGSNYQVGRYLMIHDGTTVTVVEESSIATGSMLGSFNGVINGANAELRVTLVSAGTAATVTTKIDTVTIP